MDSESSVAGTIRNIIQQLNLTTITIGHYEGHFISTAQVAVLESCADSLENLESIAGIDTPTTSQITQASNEEDGIRARRLEVAREIKKKQVALTKAIPSQRPTINLEVGKLLSERAKLDKLIAQFNASTIA